jgi:hypothetical protein
MEEITVTLVYERLKEVARNGRTATYTEIATLADLDASDNSDLANLVAGLEQIAETETKAGRPLLVIVVLRNDTNMPGKGLFMWAAKHGLYSDGDDIAFFARELRRVYDYWKTAPA